MASVKGQMKVAAAQPIPILWEKKVKGLTKLPKSHRKNIYIIWKQKNNK